MTASRSFLWHPVVTHPRARGRKTNGQRVHVINFITMVIHALRRKTAGPVEFDLRDSLVPRTEYL